MLPMMLLKDQAGGTGYNGEFSASDEGWTDATILYVPYGYDLRKTASQGIFAVPFSYFVSEECFFDYYIAHVRQGYQNNFYDVEDSDESLYQFFVSYEGKGDDLYFSVETYYSGMVPT